MTRIEFWSAVMGLLVAIVLMFNQMNGRLDTMQAENNRRLDTMQAENNRRFDEMQAEMNRRFDDNNRRLDTMQAENNRRFDQLFEALRVFERRITRLEERTGIDVE